MPFHWFARLCTQVFMRLLLVILFMQTNSSYSAQIERFPDCPATPNCVSSVAADEKHFIVPISYTGSAEKAWRVLISTVLSLPRSQLIEQSADYLHFEMTSAVFRFTDDVELILDAGKNEIQIRSASRVGYSDFGVNRRRVEMIRKLFKQNLNHADGK